MTATKIKPFPYDSLIKFSQNQALLINLLVRAIDYRQAGKMKKFINEALLRWFPQGLVLSSITLDTPETNQELESLTELVGVDLLQADTQSSLYLFLDKQAVSHFSHLLLGQNKQEDGDFKITPLMQGVFEYLLLSLVKEWNKSVSYFTLKFQKVLSEEDDVWLSSSPAQWVRLTFSFNLFSNKHTGVILIPVKIFDWVSSHLSIVSEDERLKKFGHLRTLAWAEVGNVSLTTADLAGLRKGDVILLDETVSQFNGKQLSGPIQVSFSGGRGVLLGTLNPDDGLKVKVEQFYVKEKL